ncbi:O-antigen translocase [Flavobacterium sp.]|uniref:O-antigen translocase n=1 Tax=Flavobacterium sp. TaxID=239 RepID=UPI0022BB8876|nr:O-antigen translocase [Flavobacterium sp.]MCZ8090449.1 O-antigen translocase [Flavobacterium sp.]
MIFFKKIGANELFKVFSLNGLSVFFKIIIGFITSKIIAVYVGPSGMALVGNFRNFINIFESVGLLGFQNGIIKYVAENEDDVKKQREFLSTCVISIASISVLLSFVLYYFSGFIANKLFLNGTEYQLIIVVMSICSPWYIASLFLINVLNGFGLYRKVITVNIFGNILGLILSVILIINFNTFGALLSIVLAPTLLFFVSIFYANSVATFLKFSFQSFQFKVVKNLAEYSLMAFFSSIIGSYVYLSIRNNVIENLSFEKAGYWEAITRISGYYFLFLTTILTVFFLPKLSKSKNIEETSKVFWDYFKGIIPIFTLVMILLFFSRKFVVPLLFSKEFEPTTSLFFWQLIGDIFKAVSLILGYQFFAKKLTLVFIVTEFFSLLILYFSSIYFIKIFDVEGIVMAHAFTYLIYLIVLVAYFRKTIFN